jgi:uncharacterized protein YjbJ (UPF0337 family)
MTQQQFAHFWDQLRGPLKAKWGKITDTDLEEISGNLESFRNVLQRRYGELHKYEVAKWANRRHAYWSGDYIGYEEDPEQAR